MAAKKKSLKAAKPASARKPPNKSRRKQQAKVDRPVAIKAPTATTPQQGEAWLMDVGRNALAMGHTQRAPPQANIDAYKSVAASCRANARALVEYAITAALVGGAGIVCGKMQTVIDAESSPEAAAPRAVDTGAAVAVLVRSRDGINRVLGGPSNAAERRKFGIHIPLLTASPSNVATCCEEMAMGRTRAPDSLGSMMVTAATAKALLGHAKAIRAELRESKKERKSESTVISTRNIQNAALDKFYDLYAGAIGQILPIGQERIDTLGLVPRREERRGGTEEGSGTGPGKA